MKLHTDRVDIERSGVDSETQFRIKTTAKAFDILSSGLYTDNILAVVRELSCNAYDAHVDAGRADEPFEIHLPNRMEPFFAVKDFGTGLSDDQVMTLYTTYFDSTKTDSNDFIGALGLGSKSPFSYVKSFEVISRYNGIRRVYSIFINEDGVPTIARLGEPMATDEHNGIKVKMTVEPDDFHRFQSKTSSALKWFPVKPKVIGHAYFSFDEPPETDMQGDGWYIYKQGYGSGSMRAVQGNVEYRVDINQLDEVPSSVRTFLQKVNVIAFFDIGELEVAASREEIKYDKRSKAALVAKIESIHRAALTKIEAEADKYPDSLWEAIIALDKLSNSMFRDTSALREFVQISDNEVLKAYVDSKGHVKVGPHPGHDVYRYTWGRYRRSLKRAKMTEKSAINPHVDRAFFINDMKTGGISRLTKWMQENNKDEAILIVEHKTPHRFEKAIDANGDEHMKAVAMDEQDVLDARQAMADSLGNPTILTVSQDTSKIQRSPTERMKAIFRYKTYHRNHYRADTVEWDRVDEDDDDGFDFEEGGLYFLLERGSSIKWNDKKIDWSAGDVSDNLSKILTIVNKELGLEDDERYTLDDVYGVGAIDIKKFHKHDKWVNIFDQFSQVFDKYRVAAERLSRWEQTSNAYGLKTVFKKQDFVDRINQLDRTSVLRKTVEALNKGDTEVASARLPHTGFVRDFDRWYGKNTIKVNDEAEGYIDPELLEKTYPMLEFVDTFSYNSWDRTHMDPVFDYIKLIDRSN